MIQNQIKEQSLKVKMCGMRRKEDIAYANEVKPDAIIAADGGVMEVLKKYAPDVPIHVSTQANVVSLHAANFWHKNGAKDFKCRSIRQ